MLLQCLQAQGEGGWGCPVNCAWQRRDGGGTKAKLLFCAVAWQIKPRDPPSLNRMGCVRHRKGPGSYFTTDHHIVPSPSPSPSPSPLNVLLSTFFLVDGPYVIPPPSSSNTIDDSRRNISSPFFCSYQRCASQHWHSIRA